MINPEVIPLSAIRRILSDTPSNTGGSTIGNGSPPRIER
jgi:hypothetical protein